MPKNGKRNGDQAVIFMRKNKREIGGVKMEELRNQAMETLQNGGWLTTVTEGERQVTVYSDGYSCTSFNRCDPEFTTKDIDVAVDYLYPQ